MHGAGCMRAEAGSAARSHVLPTLLQCVHAPTLGRGSGGASFRSSRELNSSTNASVVVAVVVVVGCAEMATLRWAVGFNACCSLPSTADFVLLTLQASDKLFLVRREQGSAMILQAVLEGSLYAERACASASFQLITSTAMWAHTEQGGRREPPCLHGQWVKVHAS